MKELFGNVGGKIKVLAVVSFLLCGVASFIGGIALMITLSKIGVGWIGFLIMIFGVFTSLIFAWLIYGFGEIVENSSMANREVYEIKKDVSEIKESLETLTEYAKINASATKTTEKYELPPL